PTVPCRYFVGDCERMTCFDKNLKAPFPYFGGKGTVADRIWKRLGDVKQYIEPFFGSGAVLLKRPPTKLDKIYEIVNDKDGFIANVWRSIIFDPDEVAKWCDWPINHADLNARRRVLVESEPQLIEGLQSDPEWFDAKLAGYWVWAASCWIGRGLTYPDARPHLSRNTGIHSQIPLLTHNKGVHHRPDAYEWMDALRRRLRHVKVVCGDWTRVCGGNWQADNRPCGMFFDPPYATSGRDNDIYHHDSLTVAKDVEKWVLQRGGHPDYRIAVAGYEDEYASLVEAGWTVEPWSASGGYANLGKNKTGNRHRERLFFSPHCLRAEKDKMTLFEGSHGNINRNN
ncbi:MAG: DNA adenine methylase, partial [Dehalococcoidia bacterium]|nr:DNA adenine methylase [Dehalococcoidia bacterium]